MSHVANLINDLYVISELSTEANDSSELLATMEMLGEESFEGFFTRFFNWDPVRLRSSWKRLGKIDRKYTLGMGTQAPVELTHEWDDYTLPLATRGNKVVKDLAKEVLFEISLLLDSNVVLTENVVGINKSVDSSLDDANTPYFEPKELPIFNRPLLGARVISGSENELDLIKQGLAIKTTTRVGHTHGYGRGGGITIEQGADRRGDERKLRAAGTYWDNRMTKEVVKALYLLENITSRKSLITKQMFNARDPNVKKQARLLMVWQEILYEHAYFVVHRTSKLLASAY